MTILGEDNEFKRFKNRTKSQKMHLQASLKQIEDIYILQAKADVEGQKRLLLRFSIRSTARGRNWTCAWSFRVLRERMW